MSDHKDRVVVGAFLIIMGTAILGSLYKIVQFVNVNPEEFIIGTIVVCAVLSVSYIIGYVALECGVTYEQ